MSGSSSPTSVPGLSLPNIAPSPLTTIFGIATGEAPALDIGGLKNTVEPGAPNLESPNANSSTPTLAQTNTTALQTQLASESAAAAYGSGFGNVGAALLDQPTTTSRILLGD